MGKNYPPPIISTEPGSWAHSTVTVRWPETASRLTVENDFPSSIHQQIKDLKNDIHAGSIRYLEDPAAPDLEDWRDYIQPYLGKNWREVPWFFAEHYFYRRIIEAVGYFTTRSDPFLYSKEQGLIKTDGDIQSFCKFLTEGLTENRSNDKILREALFFSLWGNQADLSLWPAGAEKNPKHSSWNILKDYLLEDHSKQIISRLIKVDTPVKQVGMILDNAGFELVTDLGLADILLGKGIAEEIVLHVKAHPTFVSDVIKEDITQTVDHLISSSSKDVSGFGERISGYLEGGNIIHREDFFWNSPLAMWELPSDLRDELSKSDFLISKGDANYRRLLGDREWDFTTPFHQVIDYLPVPLGALRTLKAELAVGLKLDQIQEVFNQDPDWMVDGKWGLIQFAPGKTGKE